MSNLLAGATTTVTGSGASIDSITPILTGNAMTIQADVSGTGAVSATVVIEASNFERSWGTLATLTLSGTTSASDLFASVPWPFVRARVTAISGTGATVNASVRVV